MFVKLFTQILDSSLADDRGLRHFFTDLLLCADSKGYVIMTPQAIARRIGATLEEVEDGLKRLSEPDRRSKTPDHEGRRIEPLEGMGYGWRIVNYETYRAMRDADQLRESTKERVRRYRMRKRELTHGNAGNDCNAEVTHGNAITEGEAETEADAEGEAIQPPTPAAEATPRRSGLRKKIEKPQPSERGFSFADWFRSTLPDGFKLQESWRENWARCYDELIRLDNRTPDQVAAVCKWARQDEFWATNFLSPLKLRQKNNSGIMYFDVFSERMKSKPAGSSVSAQQKAAKASGQYTLTHEVRSVNVDDMSDEEFEQFTANLNRKK